MERTTLLPHGRLCHFSSIGAPAPVCHKACPGSLPKAGGLTQAGPDVRKGSRGALVRCANAFQYGQTSVPSAGAQPAPSLICPFPHLNPSTSFFPSISLHSFTNLKGRMYPAHFCYTTYANNPVLVSTQVVILSYMVRISCYLFTCLSVLQFHPSRCPPIPPIRGSAPCSYRLSSSGYLSRVCLAQHAPLLSPLLLSLLPSSITPTAVRSHFCSS